MKFSKWIGSIISCMLMVSLVGQVPAHAEMNKDIRDESIYDLLVDRFFNKTIQNDLEVDAQNPAAFAGGDFLGVLEKLPYLQQMGFTIASLGPVFSSDTYDGQRVVDYSSLEKHFGTDKEFNTLIAGAKKQKTKLMVDFPIQHVSSNHVWAKENPSWAIIKEDGTLEWDMDNPDVQQAIIQAAVDFIHKFDVDGIRITSIEGIDPLFLNKMIAALKKENEKLYVMSNEESEADFDLSVSATNQDLARNAFKNVDLSTEEFGETLKQVDTTRSIDSLNERRFTADAAEENMFPPTRWKIAFATLMSIPGVPVITYGSEIAMNGEKPPESNQIMNYKVEEELIDYVGDLQKLRNTSAALRSGNIDLLHNENGFMVYKRSNADETWIVAINNTGSTQQFDLTEEMMGANLELRGLMESDILRQREDGTYRIVLDREVAEFFTVNEPKGLNKGYLAALALVYVLFLGFLYLVWRKGKQRKKDL
ncbi:MAG: alpha-amylase family glycosyl hydrolase [Paenisporosarcina sp.]